MSWRPLLPSHHILISAFVSFLLFLLLFVDKFVLAQTLTQNSGVLLRPPFPSIFLFLTLSLFVWENEKKGPSSLDCTGLDSRPLS